MRRWSLIWAAVLPVLLAGATTLRGEEAPGIRWEPDLDAALARAAREGRPVFLAINALENEGANQRLAHVLYPSASWGAASRDYVCLVANSNEHQGAGGACARYPGIPCEAHQKVMFLAYRVLGLAGDVAVISPQHLILDPDGRLAWRKEYYTGVVGPTLLETMLPRIAPMIALDRAARERADEIERLEQVDTTELEAAARTWLARPDDALAAAGVLNAIDYALDDQRRLALVRSFGAISADQRPVALVAAYEASLEPDQDPDLALSYARALLEADRPTGARLLARIAVRTKDARLRRDALATWFGGAPATNRLPDGLSGQERAAAAEVYALLGRGDVWGRSGAPPAPFDSRLRRALARGGEDGRPIAEDAPSLATILTDREAPPGELVRALLEARPSEVKAQAEGVRLLFRESPFSRVGSAAAVAMLGAGLDEAGRVAPRLWAAIQDPIEGPDVRAVLVERLGVDPGWGEEAWLAALQEALAGKGGAK